MHLSRGSAPLGSACFPETWNVEGGIQLSETLVRASFGNPFLVIECVSPWEMCFSLGDVSTWNAKQGLQ